MCSSVPQPCVVCSRGTSPLAQTVFSLPSNPRETHLTIQAEARTASISVKHSRLCFHGTWLVRASYVDRLNQWITTILLFHPKAAYPADTTDSIVCRSRFLAHASTFSLSIERWTSRVFKTSRSALLNSPTTHFT